MKVKSISHAGITVSDFEAAVRWYHEKFGFLLVSEDRLDSVATERLFPLYGIEGATVRLGFLRAPGGTVLEIFQFEPATMGRPLVWNAPGFTHIALNVAGVPRMVRRLSAMGVKFVTEPERTGNVDWVFLRDPDGNLVELIDLKASRPALKYVGGLVGALLKWSKFAPYYASPTSAP